MKALKNKEKAAILQAAVCIGDPNEIVNSHGSHRGPLSRRTARASFNRAPQLPAPNSTRSNLSWALCIGDA